MLLATFQGSQQHGACSVPLTVTVVSSLTHAAVPPSYLLSFPLKLGKLVWGKIATEHLCRKSTQPPEAVLTKELLQSPCPMQFLVRAHHPTTTSGGDLWIGQRQRKKCFHIA